MTLHQAASEIRMHSIPLRGNPNLSLRTRLLEPRRLLRLIYLGGSGDHAEQWSTNLRGIFCSIARITVHCGCHTLETERLPVVMTLTECMHSGYIFSSGFGCCNLSNVSAAFAKIALPMGNLFFKSNVCLISSAKTPPENGKAENLGLRALSIFLLLSSIFQHCTWIVRKSRKRKRALVQKSSHWFASSKAFVRQS